MIYHRRDDTDGDRSGPPLLLPVVMMKLLTVIHGDSPLTETTLKREVMVSKQARKLGRCDS